MWGDTLLALMAGRRNNGERRGEAARSAPFPQPQRYPGQGGALQAPMPQNLPPPRWNGAPPQPVRDDRGAPIQHWEQGQRGDWEMTTRPAPALTLRTSPGDSSPRGYETFGDWVNDDMRLDTEVGGPAPEAQPAARGMPPASAPGRVPPGNSGVFYQGPDEDITRLQEREELLYQRALERARNRSRLYRPDPQSQLHRDRTAQ